MKRNKMILSLTLAACASIGTQALAKDKVHHITLDQNTMIKGTMVKKGEYEVKFNEQTNAFTVLDGNRTIVTTSAKEEALSKKATNTSYDVKSTDGGPVLMKVTFGGDHYALVVDEEDSTAGK